MGESRTIENRMNELVGQLWRVTRLGKLNWQEGVRRNSYTVHFPDVSLSIVESLNGLLTLELINDKGTVIETLSPGDGEPIAPTLRETYDMARRQAVDVGGTIDKAIEYLVRRLP